MKFGRLFGIGAALLAVQPVGSATAPAQDSSEVVPGIEKADFFRPGFAPVRNAQSYDVTVVYFFDYQCPVCRQHHADVSRALAEDKRVRVIYRDTPIFGPESEAAASAAIASQLQSRHEAFHDALMSTSGPIDAAALRAAARKAKVDWERLQRDLVSHKSRIDQQVARNFELAIATGIHGTPAFIVGDALANGALDYAGLKGEISDARNASRPARPTESSSGVDDAQSAPAADPNRQAIAADEPGAERDSATGSKPAFRVAKAGRGADAAEGPAQSVEKHRPAFGWVAGFLVLLVAAIGLGWRRRRKLKSGAGTS